MLATTPLGALVDASRRKRRLLAAAIALLLAGNLAIWIAPSLAVTAASQVITGVVAALIAPCLLGITPAQCIAVGDGSNDIPMMQAAGLSVAYHAKPRVRAEAKVCINEGGLDRLLEVLK
jgi:MFS family permease